MANQTIQGSLQEVLNKFAKRDLNLTKKHGCIAVAQTKRGCVEMSYDSATKMFTMTTVQGMEVVTLFSGKMKDAVVTLAGLYDVVTE